MVNLTEHEIYPANKCFKKCNELFAFLQLFAGYIHLQHLRV